MSTVFYDPFRDFDRLFSSFFSERGAPAPQSRAESRAEARSLAKGEHFEDGEDAWRLSFELPGVSLEDVTLDVGEDHLSLSVTREWSPPEGYQPLRRERAESPVERRFTLPGAIDVANASATLVDGRLTIELPKRSKAEVRRLELQAA